MTHDLTVHLTYGGPERIFVLSRKWARVGCFKLLALEMDI